MLISQAQEKRRKYANDEAANEIDFPVETDPGWPVFFQRLEVSGYFKDLLKGSQEWESLMNSAKVFYREKVGRRAKRSDEESTESEELLKVYEDIQSHDVENSESKFNFLINFYDDIFIKKIKLFF